MGRLKLGAAAALKALRVISHPLFVGPMCVAIVLYALHHPVLPGMQGCKLIHDRPDAIECISNRFEQRFEGRSIESALRSIDASAREDDAVSEACHEAAHPVGERIGRKARRQGKPFPAVSGKSRCRLGFLHGATIGYYAGDVPDPDSVVDVVPRVCGSQNAERLRIECVHSFGHIMAKIMKSQRQAVSGCQRVELVYTKLRLSREDALHECQYGMYMEYAMDDLRTGKSPEKDDCASAPSGGKVECYKYLPVRNMLLGGSTDDNVRICERTTKPYRSACIYGFSLAGEKPKCGEFASSTDRRECRSALKKRRDGLDVDLSKS